VFGTGLIVFRETLEAALFVGIIAAATNGVFNRTRWLSFGILAGAFGSALLALTMRELSVWADGIGQDFVSTLVLSLALCMLAWHCIWVSTHSQALAGDAKCLGASMVRGQKTLGALAVAVALSVLREGAETVLFVAGLMAHSESSPGALAFSITSGLAVGMLVGWLLYRGLGKIQPRRLFLVTNGLILLLAGSLASQLAKTLSQAGWVSTLDERAWDISSLMPDDTLLGMALHGVMGYEASPSQLQLLFYLSAILLISVSAKLVSFNISQCRHLRSTVA